MGGPVGTMVGIQSGVARAALSRMKAAGLEQTNHLVREALLNPELMRTLLMTPNPANRPFIAASLRTALGRITGASAAQQADNRRRHHR